MRGGRVRPVGGLAARADEEGVAGFSIALQIGAID